MTAIRDNLCELGRMEIPRPKCQGMQFVATRGRQGFYRTIRENGAKYGIQLKPQGPKRPQLSSELFSGSMFRPATVPEEISEEIEQEPSPPLPKPQQYPIEQNNNNYKNYNTASRLPPQPQRQRTGGITNSLINRPQK
ncbi:unnamed protein product [Caenorhabditis angaria]|uniref:Uncharacterized protein n=1 Tax=Caenorhabditis angaria TaxID=860376 RepID=A0A9P1J3P6_9PELO|nr:unnamed protein product [Caenorhabditis angaria]